MHYCSGIMLHLLNFILIVNCLSPSPNIKFESNLFPILNAHTIVSQSIINLLDSKIIGNSLIFLSSSINLQNPILYPQSTYDLMLHVTIMDTSNVFYNLKSKYLLLSQLISFPKINLTSAKIVNSDEFSIVFSYISEECSICHWGPPYSAIAYLTSEGEISDFYQIDYPFVASGCGFDNIFIYEAFKSIHENMIYVLIGLKVRCTNNINRYLFRCLLHPAGYNDCQIIYNNYYFNFESNYDILIQYSNKMLIFNSQNHLILGSSIGNSGGITCYNSVLFGTPAPFPNLFALQNIVICDNLAPNLSYTKFVLIMKNDQVINIGLDCQEVNLLCEASYISISIYTSTLNGYFLPKTKLIISTPHTSINDAIINSDNNYIWILAKVISGSSELTTIFIIEISEISNQIITNQILSEIFYSNYCIKINEFKHMEIILYCFTNLLFSTEISHKSGIFQEIFFRYTFNSIDKIFSFLSYHLIGEQFVNSISKFVNNQELVIISSSLYLYLSKENINTSPNFLYTTVENFQLIIKAIEIYGSNYYYGGCHNNNNNLKNDLNSILLLYNEYNNFVSSLKVDSTSSKSCIESLLIMNSSNLIIISVSTNDGVNFLANVYQVLSDISNYSPQFLLDSNGQTVLLHNYSEQEIVISRTVQDSLGSKKYISSRIYTINFNFISEIKFQSKNEIFLRTLLINSNREFSLGGMSFINSYNYFWVSHFKDNIEISRYFEGRKGYQSSVLTAAYISKRIQAFSGYLDNPSVQNDQHSNFVGNSITYFITENGKYLSKKSYNLQGYTITSSGRIISEDKLHAYGIQNGVSIIQAIISVSIKCPLHYFVDQIEYKCFDNCIPYTFFPDSQVCNPYIKGCLFNGTIKEGYECISDKLVKSNKQITTKQIKAYFINFNQIQVVLDQSVISGSNSSKLIIAKKGAMIQSRNILIINYQSIFTSIVINVTKIEDINCVGEIYLWVFDLQLIFASDMTRLKSTLVLVENSTYIPCNNLNSDQAKAVISASEDSMSSIASSIFGMNVLSFNPFGIISVLGCINELILFQLLNCEPIYPKNVNNFMNTTSTFTLNFLPNPIDNLFPSYKYTNKRWYENNIENIGSLSIISFIYNLLFALPLFCICYFFSIFISLFLYQGYIIRILRIQLSTNFLLMCYLGIFYQLLLFSFTGVYLDNNNYDIIALNSQFLSYVCISITTLSQVYFLIVLVVNKDSLNKEEFESKYGFLYEELKNKGVGVYAKMIDNIKYNTLILGAFCLQNKPWVLLVLFFIIYLASFSYKIIIRPYLDSKNNVQILIREFLFFVLTILYNIYYFFMLKKNSSYIITKDIILLIIILIVLNEVVFSLIFFITILKEILCSSSLKLRYKYIKFYTITQYELFSSEKYKFISTPSSITSLKILDKIKRSKSIPRGNHTFLIDLNLNLNKQRTSQFPFGITFPGVLRKIHHQENIFNSNKNKTSTIKNNGLKIKQKILNPSPIFYFQKSKEDEDKTIITKEEEDPPQFSKFKESPEPNLKSKSILNSNSIQTPTFNKDEIIQVNIGRIGCMVGFKYWYNLFNEQIVEYDNIQSKDSKFLNLSNLQTQKLTFNFNSNKDSKENKECKGIFIDNSDWILKQILPFENYKIFDSSNFAVNNALEADFYLGDSQQLRKIMKKKIDFALRKQVEKINSFEGFIITHSAFGESSTNFSLLFHEICSNNFEKKIKLNLPIYDIRNNSITQQSIINQMWTTSFLQNFSDAIIPIEINTLNEKISENNLEILNQVELSSKSIAELNLMLTIPIRKSIKQSMSLSFLVKKLVTEGSHKFISSNLFPITRLNQVNQVKNDCIEIAKNTLQSNSLCNEHFSKGISKRNLIIYDGTVSNEAYEIFNKFFSILNTNPINQFQSQYTLDLINYSSIGSLNGFSDRMLYLGNSSIIVSLLSDLLKNMNMNCIPTNTEKCYFQNVNQIIARRAQLKDNISNIIKDYSNLV